MSFDDRVLEWMHPKDRRPILLIRGVVARWTMWSVAIVTGLIFLASFLSILLAAGGLFLGIVTLHFDWRDPLFLLASIVICRWGFRIAEWSLDTAQLDGTEQLDRFRPTPDSSITAQMLGQLENELAAKTAMLEQVRADTAQYEHLSSLTKGQSDEIRLVIAQQFQSSSRSGLQTQFLFLIPGFVLGLIVNWISEPVLDWVKDLL